MAPTWDVLVLLVFVIVFRTNITTCRSLFNRNISIQYEIKLSQDERQHAHHRHKQQQQREE